MILVSERSLGVVALDRLVRDKIATAMPGGHALAPGVPMSSGMRALTLAPALPLGGVIGGIAALWVLSDGGLEAPSHVEVAVRRGSNPSAPASWRGSWSYVADTNAVERATRIGSVGVLAASDAAAGALARAPLAQALPAIWAARDVIDASELTVRVQRMGRLAQRRRAVGAWTLLVEATGADAWRL